MIETETVVAQLDQLTSMPTLVFLAAVAIAVIILLIFALGRTKPATTEARIGQYNIIMLPDGKTLSGLVTLAQKEVSPSLLFELVRGTALGKKHAETLTDVFKELFFYAMRAGRKKLLICSSQNLESPEYALVTTETFVFPFGYVPRRLVIGDATEEERGAWTVITVEPRSLETGLTAEVFAKMKDIGGAAAAVKEASLIVKREMPWKEVAKAREKQVTKAHERVAEAEGKASVIELALTSKPLLTPEIEGELPPIEAKEGLFSFWRIVCALIAFVTCMVFIPEWFPQQNPLIPALIVTIVTFGAFNRVKKTLQRWV